MKGALFVLQLLYQKDAVFSMVAHGTSINHVWIAHVFQGLSTGAQDTKFHAMWPAPV